MQQLTSNSNAKSLSANEIVELNRKFNLLEVTEGGFNYLELDANANSKDECTLGLYPEDYKSFLSMFFYV